MELGACLFIRYSLPLSLSLYQTTSATPRSTSGRTRGDKTRWLSRAKEREAARPALYDHQISAFPAENCPEFQLTVCLAPASVQLEDRRLLLRTPASRYTTRKEVLDHHPNVSPLRILSGHLRPLPLTSRNTHAPFESRAAKYRKSCVTKNSTGSLPVVTALCRAGNHVRCVGGAAHRAGPEKPISGHTHQPVKS